MSLAPLSADDAPRIAAVNSYVIPDAPHAVRLDIFARLASRVCRVPISVITLVGEDRVLCKSAVGVSPCECARLWVPCAYTLLRPDEVTVCEDARRDMRFRDDSALMDGTPSVRFYAGAALRNREGIPLGVLAVIDTEPHQLAAGGLDLLTQLAGAASSSLEQYRDVPPSPPAGDVPSNRRTDDRDLPVSAWELMANWLAQTHPECDAQTTDAWVPHYVKHHPKLVEQLLLEAGQAVAQDFSLP